MQTRDNENPFVPSAGEYPPCLAGRGDVQAWFEQALHRVARGASARNEVIVYAPRGHGKTVLLSEEGVGKVAARQRIGYLRKAGGSLRGDLLDTIEGQPPRLADDQEIVARFNVLGLADLTSKRGEQIVAAFRGQPGRVGMARLVGTLLAMQPPAGGRGLLLMVDEAHETDPDDLRDLLNAAQNLRRNGLLVVLAGTPGLKPRLETARATFWDRSQRFSPGLLNAEATEQALCEPLAKEGITVEQETLERMVEESQGYPYFVQLMGRAVWDALPVKGARVDAEVLTAALPAYAQERDAHYRQRAGEIDRAGLVRPAVVLGQCIQSRLEAGNPAVGAVAMRAYMQHALEMGLGEDLDAWSDVARGPAMRNDPAARDDLQVRLQRAEETGKAPRVQGLASTAAQSVLDYLAAKGYAWEPESGGYRFGIPSLRSFLKAEAESEAHIQAEIASASPPGEGKEPAEAESARSRRPRRSGPGM